RFRLKRCSSPAWGGAPMSDRSVAISSLALSSTATTSPAVVRPTAVRTKLLLEGPVLTTLLRLAAPNVLNLLAIAGMITFDGLFVGRLGPDALAGVSLAFPFVMLIQHTAASGMGGGVSSAIARALGAGKRDVGNALTLHAFVLALGLAAQQTAGNGVVTSRGFDPQTGRLTAILAGAGSIVENFSYTYDVLGNVHTRADANESLSETF